MTRKHKQRDMIAKLANGVKKQCNVSDEPNSAQNPAPPLTPGNIILDKDINPQLLVKWPKLKLKVPPIFLHKPVEFEQHVKKVLNMGIQFYQPHRGKNYIKITCVSHNDHKNLMQYFEKKQLPYHSYGNPSKRKMKVVIRGLPKETELNEIKEVLKSVSIPVLRVHRMCTKVERKDKTMLVLAVVPYDDQGKAILKVTQILGHHVKLEPPVNKPKQCHRCQKWGHSQRYCHGIIKCVKCAGEHFTKKCDKISENELPKCANCSGDHTANYKRCMFTPGSEQYQMMQGIKTDRPCYKPIQLVTMDNYHKMYRNVDYNKKTSKPIIKTGIFVPTS